MRKKENDGRERGGDWKWEVRRERELRGNQSLICISQVDGFVI